jgi:translocation and assembly module TamB
VIVTGQGRAAVTNGKLALSGRLTADEGRLEIGTTALPQLGEDVVIVGRERSTPAREEQKLKALALDLGIALGGDVHVLGRGLNVWLSGDVHLYTNEQGEVRAKGTVSARNGTFVAYGQRLEIDRGRLYFNGPIDDPGLDILAVRRRLAVEPGVEVTGTLHEPLVRVVSNPSLPQGEALSWLLLGHGPSDAAPGELSALPLAQSALLGKATGSIARRLNLDELAVGTDTASSSQVVTLGKRLNDRIYVTFQQALGAAGSALRLELTLTRHILLRAQAGATSLVGLFYHSQWD